MKKVVIFCILALCVNLLGFSQTAVNLDTALFNSTSYLRQKMPAKTKVAVLNCTSKWPEMSDYIIEELIGYIVNDGTLTVVDRQNLDTISKEMKFQLSGEVSDETAQSIGKKLGAQTIINSAITPVGDTYRLRIRAISVETAQILGVQNVDVAQDSRSAALTGTAYSGPSNVTNTQVAANASSQLNVWSFTDELEGLINKYYKPAKNKKLTFQSTIIPSDKFPVSLDTAFATRQNVPDVIGLEAAFVRKYIESGQLMDITDIYNANRNKLLAYPVEIGTYNGRVYALSWQACPGALFYRRSLAKKYLGTDDPKTVQSYFNTVNRFLDTALLIKEKSGGSCVVVSSQNALYDPFLSNRLSPWIVDGKLVIDPMMETFLDICKRLNDNGLLAGIGQWSDNWFASMRGEGKNWEGKPVEVFSYFLPTWGLPYILKSNAPKTSGDWAMIPGPLPYNMGGTWIGVYKGTSNPDAAKDIIRYLTTDNSFLEKYAKESGDLVSNTEVVDKIKKGFKESFLNKQNHYADFADMALRVNGKLIQGTDQEIKAIFEKEVFPYIWGEKSKEQALADFRTQVKIQLGY